MSGHRANMHTGILTKKEMTEMENRNLELYLQNCQIIQENDRLRRIAQELKLNKENHQAMLKQTLGGDPNGVKNPEPGLQLQLGSSSQQEKSSKADAQSEH
ncbi:putative protein LITTLE ZIPPER [Helianthus anomalus]